MAGFNNVTLVGNLTRNPKIKTIPSGQKVCEMAIAVNREFTSNGEKKSQVMYIDVQAWGKSAEICAKFLAKGRPVLVNGRLEYQTWEKNGQKSSKHFVTAEKVQFLSGGPKPSAAAPASDEVPF